MFPKKILSIVQEKKFNLHKSIQYHLLITIGHGLLKIGCIECVTKTCLLLGIYEVPLDSQHPDYIKSLERLYNEDFLLIKSDWGAVTLIIANQKFAILPHLLLSKEDLPTYMHVACGVDLADEVISFTHMLAKISVVFAENVTVLNWFRQYYVNSNLQIIHQANAIIAGVQEECASIDGTILFSWLEAQYLHIVVDKRSRLLYYNVFAYESGDDFLSYLSAVVQAVQLKRPTCMVWVGGYIEKNSLAYQRLKAYMPKVTLKTHIDFLSNNRYILKKSNTVPMLYFDLISGFLCHPNSHGFNFKH